MLSKHFKISLFALILALSASHAYGQGKKKKSASPSQATLAQRVAKARAELIQAAKDHKSSLEKLLALQQAELKEKAEKVDALKALPPEIVSKKDVEKSEQDYQAVQAKVKGTQNQIAESDHLVAEVIAEEKLEKMGRPRPGAYQATAALIRYNGPTRWMLADAAKVQSFFLTRFNRSLPISAYGQTSTHNKLGFNHSNSIDVAVHPDSAEGQALIAFLRGAGIPFIAFRQAVSGQATGAHIHIGYPSHRIRY